MRLYSFVAAAVLASVSVAAHADVMYSYVGGGFYAGYHFHHRFTALFNLQRHPCCTYNLF